MNQNNLSNPFGVVEPDPILRFVFDYWLRKCMMLGRLPGRQHFDPVDVARKNPKAIPHIWLLDVERNPYRFRYRLIGHWLKEAGALCRVGDYVDEFVDKADPDNLQIRLVRVVEERVPDFRSGSPQLPHSELVAGISRLSLPLSLDGNAINMILCASNYRWTASSGRGHLG